MKLTAFSFNSGNVGNDKELVAAFYRRLPVMERLASINSEMNRYLDALAKAEPHEKNLPAYCYHIFDKFRLTYFRELPQMADTIQVIGTAEAVKAAKTIEAVKQVLKIDWLRLGKCIGIGMRGERFVKMEAAPALEREGLMGKQTFIQELAMVIDRDKIPQKPDGTSIRDAGKILVTVLENDTAPHLENLEKAALIFEQLAYAWGSDAMAEYSEGIAKGLNGFMDADAQPVGESPRANLYWFLLLAWPEIKVMLESKPKKTITDLHEWMQPFMRQGITSQIGLKTLRDVCAPPPSGIGLSLRPVKARRKKSSRR